MHVQNLDALNFRLQARLSEDDLVLGTFLFLLLGKFLRRNHLQVLSSFEDVPLGLLPSRPGAAYLLSGEAYVYSALRAQLAHALLL